MSDDWWATPAGVQTVLREEIKIRNDRIGELEAKLAQAMEHVADYSNDPHLVEWANATVAELKGEK